MILIDNKDSNITIKHTMNKVLVIDQSMTIVKVKSVLAACLY